ncbi:hypothetical protein K432DRAFT_384048 [Lepidopterella palustris CBS 459.81]|uniref:Uncharacterized protein n=1 Tax=Lepidopterella palustris CBS 459.81 TaxID=1314670 RepID=A0A8E2E6S1_9PEZI|nr:hypothetical protein K432DRAFT_384048 [Lepidopterella palustris CBS 459.81]
MSMTNSASFIEHSDEADEINSIPSTSTTSSVSDDDEVSDAEREWRESLQQLELLLTMVLVPYLGKYFGRKCAYWGWAKFMEWKYPVEVVVTNPMLFKGAGAIEAAASL